MRKAIKVLLLMSILLLSTTVTSAATQKATLKKGKVATVYVTNGNKVKLSAASGLKWTSSKKQIASVKKSGKYGMVTTKSRGTTIIKAVKGKTKYTCKLVVEVPYLKTTSFPMHIGDSKTVKMNGTKQKVKWTSKNPSIAKVTSNGKVFGVSAGVTDIVAKVGGKSYVCNVTVYDNPIFTPDTPTDPTPTPDPTPESTIGSRVNPYNAFAGATIPLYDWREYVGQVNYRVTKMLTGEDAKEVLSSYSLSKIPDGFIPVYLEFNFKYLSGANELNSSDIMWYSNFYNSDATSMINYDSFLTRADESVPLILHVNVYPGADTTFYIAFVVKPSDMPLTFRVQTGYDENHYEQTYSWFTLAQ